MAKLHFLAANSPRTAPCVSANHKSTYKKVVVRKLDHGVIKGFVDPAMYLGPDGIEMLDREGRAVIIPLSEIKAVFFVRDFDGNRQRWERKLFQSRPRMAGLWVQMTFKDNEVMEGLLPSNLIDINPQGFMVTPADLYSNNLKIFIPRTALTKMDALGVIPNGRLRRLARRGREISGGTATSESQIGLFPVSEGDREKS